jgi:hypothetical protein
MTLPSNDHLTEVMHELEELRAERGQQTAPTTGHRWRLRTTGWLTASLIVVASWAWSAQTSAPILPDIEKRLNALESLVHKGPGNTTQVTAPFDVTGPDGKVILRVGSDAPTTGAIAIWSSPDKPGKVAIRSEKGNILAELGVKRDGYGVVIAADENGVPRAELTGAGRAVLYNEDKKLIAGMGAGEQLGELVVVGRVVVVDDNGVVRAALNNSGQVVVGDEDKNIVAKMEATDKNRGRVAAFGEIVAVDETENKVAGLEVISGGRGRVGVWNKGTTVASIEVDDKNANAGAVTIKNTEGKVVAKVGADATTGGNGIVFAADAKGLVRAQLRGNGEAAVLDDEKNPVARMVAAGKNRGRVLAFGELVAVDEKANKVAGLQVTGESRGEVAVWHKGNKVTSMKSDAQGAGVLTVMNGEGKAIAEMGAGRTENTGISSIGAGEDGNGGGALTIMNPAGKVVAKMDGRHAGGGLGIMNSTGKRVAALTATQAGVGYVGVANSGGLPIAEMSLQPDGRGSFTVFKNRQPIALLTEMVERPGGLLQISNLKGPVANITVTEGGGGYFQLINASGLPTVEAGTLPSGAGTVRAGPFFKCSPFQAAMPLIQYGLPDCIVGDESGKNPVGPQRNK